MADSKKPSTIISAKGQVTLPGAIRKRRKWGAGTRLEVEDTPEGVLLKRAPTFAATRPQDVFSSLLHSGRPKMLEEMDAGVLAEAWQRQPRD